MSKIGSCRDFHDRFVRFVVNISGPISGLVPAADGKPVTPWRGCVGTWPGEECQRGHRAGHPVDPRAALEGGRRRRVDMHTSMVSNATSARSSDGIVLSNNLHVLAYRSQLGHAFMRKFSSGVRKFPHGAGILGLMCDTNHRGPIDGGAGIADTLTAEASSESYTGTFPPMYYDSPVDQVVLSFQLTGGTRASAKS